MVKINLKTGVLTASMVCLLMTLSMNLQAQSWPPTGMVGNGSSGSPWQITTPAHLAALAAYVNAGNGNNTNGKYYKLMNEIDLSGYASGTGWIPIGIGADMNENADYSLSFQGNFDGGGKAIKNLTINNIDMIGYDAAGLFGFVYDGKIENLGVENCMVTAGSGGGLVGGIVSNASVYNCYTTGVINGNGVVGGLVGGVYFGASVSNCYSTCNVNGEKDYIGGLVGGSMMNSTISNCHATGNVIGNTLVGGLLGFNLMDAVVSNCYATGNVTGNIFGIGGLVGGNGNLEEEMPGGIISNCYATGSVSGGSCIGGLVGVNVFASISDSYATGSIHGIETENANGASVGGFVGVNASYPLERPSSISNCYATGHVDGLSGIGGFAGTNTGASISNCYATGNVNARSFFAGGFTSDNLEGASMSNCYAMGSVSGLGYVGGLAGINGGTIKNCVAAGNSVVATAITTNINRIAGFGSIGACLNNYAFEDMVVTSFGSTVPVTDGLNTIAGMGVDMNTLQTLDFYTTTGNWNGGAWDISSPTAVWKICEDNEELPFLRWQGIICAETYIIAVSANPSAGGVVSGGGRYNQGALVTVTATANPNYAFLNWTEGGAEVSTNATYTFNAEASRTLVANFENTAPTLVTGVTLDESTYTMEVCLSKQLTATVLPADATNKKVIWSSSDEGVAKVSQTGFVTGVSEGTATITVTTEDGGFTAQCVFTITACVTPPSGIGMLNCPDEEFIYINTVVQLTVEWIPYFTPVLNAIWTSSNPNTAIVDQTGKVTAMTQGVTLIKASTPDGKFTAECAIRVIQPVEGVKLNKNTLTLSIGAEEVLIATVLPVNAYIKDISWKSANGAFATVDATGKVKGVALGTTTITVTTLDGGKTATCDVTVIPSYVSPTGITINPTTLNMDKGKTHSLVATVTPAGANPAVTWSSSSATIATVDATGKVTALAVGKATITAKTINGFSATCTVTVSIAIDSIVIDPQTCTLPLKGAKALKATVYPSDASNKTLVWSSSDVSIATVSTTGTVTAKSVNGKVEIYATNAASGVVGTCVVTVGTGKSSPMVAETDEITVYPNPTMGEFKVSSLGFNVTGIEIFDVMGKHVQSLRFNVQDSGLNFKPETLNCETVIDISQFPSGVYFIRIQTENGMITRKVVKQ